MWVICKKEWKQFFSNLTGYMVIVVFLLANGLALFVFDGNIFSFGYATLDRFFQLAPWILLLLIPAVTMRSFADEFKQGTYELLKTLPLSTRNIIVGKFLGCFLVAFVALVPTFTYIISVQQLSVGSGLDVGATIGAYIGLFFLALVFSAIGICASSFTNNAVVAFIISLIACVLLFYGFNAISKLPFFTGGVDYYIEMAGIDFHYSSMSRGVIDTRNVIYFLSTTALLLLITERNLGRKV